MAKRTSGGGGTVNRMLGMTWTVIQWWWAKIVIVLKLLGIMAVIAGGIFAGSVGAAYVNDKMAWNNTFNLTTLTISQAPLEMINVPPSIHHPPDLNHPEGLRQQRL